MPRKAQHIAPSNSGSLAPRDGRGVLIVCDDASAEPGVLAASLARELTGWSIALASPGDDPAPGPGASLGLLKILAIPMSDAARPALAKLAARAVAEGWAASVEVIGDWPADATCSRALASHDADALALALATVIRRGIRPDAAPHTLTPAPARRAGADIDRLVMIGISAEGALGRGLGPRIDHVSPAELAALKRPGHGVYDLLRELAAEPGVLECFIWNTCARMELYAWAEGDAGAVVERLRSILFPAAPPGTHIATLRASEARLHLARTACGLNSTMAGDAEVILQLRAAQRMAAYTGAAGARAESLVGDAERLVAEVRDGSAWGAHMREYTHVALDGVVADRRAELARARCTVMGGSTTALSTLRYILALPASDAARITAIYRGEGRRRLVSQIRQVAGDAAQRVRVGSYDDPAVGRALTTSDWILLGVDRREPVLTRASLADRGGRPVTIVDFNTFGSTEGLDGLSGVRVIGARELGAAVERASVAALADPAVHGAALDAERVIAAALAQR